MDCQEQMALPLSFPARECAKTTPLAAGLQSGLSQPLLWLQSPLDSRSAEELLPHPWPADLGSPHAAFSSESLPPCSLPVTRCTPQTRPRDPQLTRSLGVSDGCVSTVGGTNLQPVFGSLPFIEADKLCGGTGEEQWLIPVSSRPPWKSGKPLGGKPFPRHSQQEEN